MHKSDSTETTANENMSAKNPLFIAPPRIGFYGSVCRQNFPFRDSFMLYITRNPSSPNLFLKLIQTCKYFFHKNPILVISSPMSFNYNCRNYVNNKWHLWLNEENIDLQKFTSKIWITNEAKIINGTTNAGYHDFDFPVIPKIYQCDIKKLVIHSQNFSLNSFIVVASNCKIIILKFTVIISDTDHSIVPLEKIIQNLPKMINFEYILNGVSSTVITSKTIQELLKLPHFSNFDRFHLFSISESLGIENLYHYIKGNKKTNIRVDFNYEISEKCKHRLREIVDEILQAENRDYKVPMILFPDMNDETKMKLFKLWAVNISVVS